jgi:hypothetical protein
VWLQKTWPAGVDQDIQHLEAAMEALKSIVKHKLHTLLDLRPVQELGNVDVRLLQHLRRLLNERHLYRIIEVEREDVPA